MPNAGNDETKYKHVLLCGTSGVGKSTLAYYAPGPFAVLALDKSSVDIPPCVDATQVYYKTFPPALIDLTNDKHGRPRNIADQIHRDVQLLRDHFTVKKPLLMPSGVDTKATEEWPTPKTIVLEGGDFLAQHMLNLICAQHGKQNPADFGNKYEAWGLRLNECTHVYDILTYLPCNVIVTTGVHKDEETGAISPELGGSLCDTGPRKFHSSLYVYAEAGKHFVRTRSNVKFKGLKIGGRWDATETVEITLKGGGSQANPWEQLFGG